MLEYTVNSEIMTKFLLLRKMQQGYKRNSLNSHFKIFSIRKLNTIFLQIVNVKIAFKSKMTKSQ